MSDIAIRAENLGKLYPSASLGGKGRPDWLRSGPSQRGGNATILKSGEIMLDLNKEIRERRTLRGYHRLPEVLMVGKRLYLRMMRGIVVAEDQMASAFCQW